MPATTLAAFTWLPMDTWIVVVGALSAASCALPGTYLVLRRMSMMGDAISHAVLPGLAVAFLLSGSRDSLVMLAGAGVVGVLTALFTQWIHSSGRVEQGASMGVVFTVLFAVGLVLIREFADRVDLDPDCVLCGAIELVPLDTVRLFGLDVPRAAVTIGAALGLNVVFIVLFYKELKISAFDPALATTLGINATLMHYMLMILVAITTVAAFESVGSILVIAMLIVPPAAAHLLTDRLSVMLVLSVVLSAAAAAGGHVAAIATPSWFGFPGMSTSTAGMMAVVAGLIFAGALVAGPRHGVVSKIVHRAALSLRIARQDVLGLLYRLQEKGLAAPDAPRVLKLRPEIGGGPLLTRLALFMLCRQGLVARAGDSYCLTAAGHIIAKRLVRSHRLWESYLGQNLQLPPDHVHPPAERLEHVTGSALQVRLATSMGNPSRDPHGRPIPPSEPRPSGSGTS